MAQIRLVNLSILSNERDIAADIDLTSMVREFVKAKPIRVTFLTITLYCHIKNHIKNFESLAETFNAV